MICFICKAKISQRANVDYPGEKPACPACNERMERDLAELAETVSAARGRVLAAGDRADPKDLALIRCDTKHEYYPLVRSGGDPWRIAALRAEIDELDARLVAWDATPSVRTE